MSRLECNSEISSAMLGLVVVVLVGIGLAMIVNRRYEFSTHSLEFQRESKATQVDLAEVRDKHDELTQRLLRSKIKASAQIKEQQLYSSERQRLISRRTELISRQGILVEKIDRLTKEFINQLNDSRQQSREQAIGQKIDELQLRSGRKYSEVTIVRVTDQGLEIRHIDGTARIPSEDLDEKMEQRFQWAAASPE